MSKAPDAPLDALNLAAAAAVVEREYLLGDFARLADRLATTEGEARARIAFRSADGVPAGELQVRAKVVLTCQRCLGPMRRTVESTSQLAFVVRENTPMPADHEAIAGDPRRVDLAVLVEDELLLSLPLIATHRAGEGCVASLPQSVGDAGVPPRLQERRRPFAGLKDLLKH